MKKYIKKIAVLMLAVIIMIPAATADTYASSKVTVTGGDQVKGGDVFSVTVVFDGDDIGRVVGDITYDTEMLSYISGGSSSGNVGYVELKNAGTGEPLKFELKFQALKEGSTELRVSASEMYDLNEVYMDTPSTTKTVTITGNADDEEIVEETTVEDDAADEGLSVDEIGDAEEATDAEASESGFIAKAIMFGIGALVLILIIALLLRRKRK